MRTPFAHFLSLRIPKNAVSQNVHIPPFLESYDTAPKITHHQAFQPPGLFPSPLSFPKAIFFFFFFFLSCGGGLVPLSKNNLFTLFSLDCLKFPLNLPYFIFYLIVQVSLNSRMTEIDLNIVPLACGCSVLSVKCYNLHHNSSLAYITHQLPPQCWTYIVSINIDRFSLYFDI